jgi:hypothetical protein
MMAIVEWAALAYAVWLRFLGEDEISELTEQTSHEK